MFKLVEPFPALTGFQETLANTGRFMVGIFFGEQKCEGAENLAAAGVTTAMLSKASVKVVRDAHVSLAVTALQHVKGNHKQASASTRKKQWWPGS